MIGLRIWSLRSYEQQSRQIPRQLGEYSSDDHASAKQHARPAAGTDRDVRQSHSKGDRQALAAKTAAQHRWRNQTIGGIASYPGRAGTVATWRGFRGGDPVVGLPGAAAACPRPVTQEHFDRRPHS